VRPPARNSVWISGLDADHTDVDPNLETNGKFVTIEPASAQLTKAFTPHGLLQAGLQDKEDRSARKQEEVARETGSSLVNVPNKPPPPQTGLLGAITAHERDRKGAGGIGAALTERERDRRLAVSALIGFDSCEALVLTDVCPNRRNGSGRSMTWRICRGSR
jgi:CCR4-NOT transcriptional complex subunit CAF120